MVRSLLVHSRGPDGRGWQRTDIATCTAMTVSVLYVVPTFNRAAELPRTLKAIAAQRWPDTLKTVLVVDNSSTDATPEVLAEIASGLPFKLEHLRKAPE